MNNVYDRAAYSYVFDVAGIDIPDDWKCLDLGCGTNPWPRANVFVDINQECKKHIPHGKKFVLTNGEDLSIFKDKEFDFVSCFHVIEHCNDPKIFASEISRISNRGIIASPSIFKEVLFMFEESDHKWWIWKKKEPLPHGTLLFLKKDYDFLNKIQDHKIKDIMTYLYRGRSNLKASEDTKLLDNVSYFFPHLKGTIKEMISSEDLAYFRKYFFEKEPYFDIIHYWQDKLEIKII